MQIEVNVQDCFHQTDLSDDEPIQPLDPAAGGISLDTWETWFETWLKLLSSEVPVAPSYELSLRLTDDAEIQILNSQYRHQNRPTDVLAFASLEVDCPQPAEMLAEMPLYLGDIAISVETAHRQAERQQHPLKTELAWLAAHGFLHLLGWDHPDEESLMQMLDRQETLLQAIGLVVHLA